MLVLDSPAAADARAGVERQLQRPFVAAPLAESAVAVGVGVDQAGHDQTVGCIDFARIGGRRHTGRADFGDGIAGDEDVGRGHRTPGDVQDEPAADYLLVG